MAVMKISKLVVAALVLVACSQQVAPPPAAPASAVDAALLQVAAWAAAHKAPAEDVEQLARALQQHKYPEAISTARKALEDSEVAGEYVPKELLQLVQIADDAAHSLATPPDSGAAH